MPILAGIFSAFSFFQICPIFLSWIFPFISSGLLLMTWSSLLNKGLNKGLNKTPDSHLKINLGNNLGTNLSIRKRIFESIKKNRSSQYAFLCGWLFGLIFFGLGVSWVYVSIHDFGNVPLLQSAFITFVFALFLGLFPAFHGYFLNLFFSNFLNQKPKEKKKEKENKSIIWPYYLLAFPALGSLLELLKSWIFTGFPWLEIGITQIHGPLSGFAPIIGSYGCSLMIYFVTGLVVYFLRAYLDLKNSQNINEILNKDLVLLKLVSPLALAIFILFSGYFLSLKSWTTPLAPPILVSLIQGNIPQSLKWDADNAIHSLKTYYQATEKLPHSRLIIWPETAIPLDQIEAKEYLTMLYQLLQKNNPDAALITGIPFIDPDKNQYFNASILLGNGEGIYQKNHLVPFGEYIPFHAIFGMIFEFLNIPMSDFTAGPKNQILMTSGGLSIANFICYETAYGNYVREQAKNSNLIVALSDDAWFGNSEGPYQHLEISQMRALENGRYFLNSTNNGVTAVITPEGEILKKIPQFEKQILTTSILPMEGETPYEKMGLWPIWISIILMLFIANLIEIRQKN
jgi:apolipoprotein N-acyltransferase